MHRTVELAREQGVMDRVHVVHCDLGRVEWEGVRELAVRQAAAYGLDCRVVSREKGDLLDQVEFERKAWPAIGIAQFCTGDPTMGPVGRVIRKILKRQIAAGPDTVALLFAADRTEHLYEENDGILSHLRRGELVICDRYLFSSLAYQSLACDPEFVFYLNSRFPLPRHLVFLNTPVTLSQPPPPRCAGN